MNLAYFAYRMTLTYFNVSYILEVFVNIIKQSVHSDSSISDADIPMPLHIKVPRAEPDSNNYYFKVF